ncbi:hypothetical protein EDC04DRAFT_2802576 [Pisolithus marmoratus]|nr:hypothetical protein EDC04DRAFT_2802576 [Pisolithus marmoratus]
MVGQRLSVAQIMSWAAKRKTMRVGDRVNSLMGLFGVNMPMCCMERVKRHFGGYSWKSFGKPMITAYSCGIHRCHFQGGKPSPTQVG